MKTLYYCPGRSSPPADAGGLHPAKPILQWALDSRRLSGASMSSVGGRPIRIGPRRCHSRVSLPASAPGMHGSRVHAERDPGTFRSRLMLPGRPGSCYVPPAGLPALVLDSSFAQGGIERRVNRRWRWNSSLIRV